MERVRFLPWAGYQCDAALLAGRALTETAPHSDLVAEVTDLAGDLDPRMAAPTTRTGRRERRHGRRGARPVSPSTDTVLPERGRAV